MALGFPPFGLWPLALISFYFLGEGLLDPRLKNFRDGFWYLGAYSFFVNLFGFYWLSYLLTEFANLPWVASVPLMLAIFVLLSVFSALMGGLWVHLRNKNIFAAYGPALWLFIFFFIWDYVDYRFFPWSPIMSVGSNRYLLASVGLLGNWGWRTLFFGLVCWACHVGRQRGWQNLLRRKLPAMLLVLFFAGLLGFYQIQRLQKLYPQRQPVALLQGNVGNYEKKLSKLGVAPTVENVLNIHEKLLDQVYKRFAHERYGTRSAEPWIFWPETAFPSYPLYPGPAAEWFKAQLYRIGGMQMLGAYERDVVNFGGQRVPLDFNTVQLFHEQFGFVGLYRKHIRIAFGEYIPLEDYFPRAYEWLPMVNHFGRGYELRALAHPKPEGPVFVPVVCYEILHESFVKNFIAETRKNYPERDLILVNPTNDSWYGPTSEPSQHSLLARWQTALVALPMLRPTNTGFSQIVAPWGEVLATTERDESRVVFGELPVRRQIWRGQ